MTDAAQTPSAPRRRKNTVHIDPAAFGEDKTVLTIEIDAMPLLELAGLVQSLGEAAAAEEYIVDAAGLGVGVYDVLRSRIGDESVWAVYPATGATPKPLSRSRLAR